MESMHQRAEKLGGKLLVVSNPEKGTSVKVLDVPIASSNNDLDSR
jgi:nitrate/nitrite-specific signal transduction histidine kinase